MPRWHDWDQTGHCDAQAIEMPATEDEVVSVVQTAIRTGVTVRPYGAGHSWSPLVRRRAS
jgi:FAD/FMN-containing dehydrogenase